MKKVTGSENKVEAQHSTYKEWMKESLLPRTLLQGTKGMQVAGKLYLPQDKMESNDNYKNRLARSILVNFYKKTLSFLGGQVFTKDIVIADNAPDVIDRIKDDVDLSGNSLNTFVKRHFEAGLGKGVAVIYVDSNNKDKEYTSKAEEIEDGIRPYLRIIDSENIFSFIIENGIIKQVRFMEYIEEREGRFGTTIVEQIKVLEPGIWETYRQEKNSKNWALHSSGVTSLSYVPIVAFIPGEATSDLTGETPLLELAELNLDHWQIRSDLKNISHICCVPILFGKQIDLANVTASAHSAVVSDGEAADLRYIELNGKSIDTIIVMVKEIEAKAALYGLQQLIPRTGNQTATEKAIASAETNSSLGCWVGIEEMVIRRAMEMVCDYEKVKDQFEPDMISLNRDFTSGIIDYQLIDSFIKMVENGILSAQSAFDEIQKKGIVSEELDWLEISAEMENENKDKGTLSLFGKPTTGKAQ